MAAQTTSGSAIYLSAGLPATYDVTGFEALTYTAIGEVTGAGNLPTTTNVPSYLRVSDGVEVKLKGSTSYGESSFELTYNSSDAGQTLAQNALASKNNYSVKVVLGDGLVIYRKALVTGFDITLGGADDIVSATLTVSWNGALVFDI